MPPRRLVHFVLHLSRYQLPVFHFSGLKQELFEVARQNRALVWFGGVLNHLADNQDGRRWKPGRAVQARNGGNWQLLVWGCTPGNQATGVSPDRPASRSRR